MLSKTAFPVQEMEVARATDAIWGSLTGKSATVPTVRQSLRLEELDSWTQAHEDMLLYIWTFDTAPVALQMSFTDVISRLVQDLSNGTYLGIKPHDRTLWSIISIFLGGLGIIKIIWKHWAFNPGQVASARAQPPSLPLHVHKAKAATSSTLTDIWRFPICRLQISFIYFYVPPWLAFLCNI